MKVTQFGREFLATLNEILLRTSATETATEPPETLLDDMGSAPVSPHPPSSQGEDVGPPSTAPLTVPLSIHEDISRLLHPTNQLIYSPLTMAVPLLRPFLERVKTVLLVCARSCKTFQATLRAVHASYMVVDTDVPILLRNLDEIILAVFTITPQQHYVMQTSIRTFYAFRLELAYHDPRSDVRYDLHLQEPVSVALTSAQLVDILAERRGEVGRQTVLGADECEGKATGHILDLYREAGETAYSMPPLAPLPPLTCTLRNMSLGGMGVTLEEPRYAELFAHRLILLTCCFPRTAHAMPRWANRVVTLQLLGIVRGISHSRSVHRLHIRFLQRPQRDIESLLRALARETVQEVDTP